ncbi:MAG: M23 family metallopeptidase [Gammaproteobacteria bacterium]|nr:M23 family metallopeptidase [Gammaproteobacteria bacterium]
MCLIGAGLFATSVALASIPLPEPNALPGIFAAPTLQQLLGLSDIGDQTSTTTTELAETDTTRSDIPVLRRQYWYQLFQNHSLAVRMDAVGQLQELVGHNDALPNLPFVRTASNLDANESQHVDVRLAYVTGRIEESFFDRDDANEPTDPLVLELAKIFGWDIDFALDVNAGDRFAVIHEEKYWRGQKIANGEILAAEFVNRGQTYRAIGFRGPDGKIAYYTPSGSSLRRAFLRTPVKFSRVTSLFSRLRYHPLLKMWLAHNGVDYAAPEGTPIHATASGRITALGWQTGYGKTITIDHGNAFSTVYAHLSRFRTNLKVGQEVTQATIIGTVGSTGLATGPHLHYELRVDGHYQDPLTFEFPTGETIAPELRADFQRTTTTALTQLDFVSGRSVAMR